MYRGYSATSGKPGKKEPSRFDDSVLQQRLDGEERRLLADSYKCVAQDAADNGIRVIITLLEEHPGYKRLWPQFLSVSDGDLITASELRIFSERFMPAIGQVVDALACDDDATLRQCLRMVASSHAANGIALNHINDMSAAFIPMLNRAVAGQLQQQDEAACEAVWHKFFGLFGLALQAEMGKCLQVNGGGSTRSRILSSDF